MTRTTDNNSTVIDEREISTLCERGYEWTCPYCGQSRLNSSVGEGGETQATAALRSHILASDGAGHCARNELPADESLMLSEHVVSVDGD